MFFFPLLFGLVFAGGVAGGLGLVGAAAAGCVTRKNAVFNNPAVPYLELELEVGGGLAGKVAAGLGLAGEGGGPGVSVSGVQDEGRPGGGASLAAAAAHDTVELVAAHDVVEV